MTFATQNLFGDALSSAHTTGAGNGGITSVPRRDAASALRQLENRTAGVPIRVGGDSSPPREISLYRKLMAHRLWRNPGRRGHREARAGGTVFRA
jgi:hypothetical protein